MTTITIWSHWENKTWEGDLDDLAGLTVREALDYIFRYFSRVDDDDHHWLLALGYDLPSLSVDDIVTIDGVSWRCAGVGWERVDV